LFHIDFVEYRNSPCSFCCRPVPVVAPPDPHGGGGDAERTSYLERMCSGAVTEAVETRRGTFGEPWVVMLLV